MKSLISFVAFGSTAAAAIAAAYAPSSSATLIAEGLLDTVRAGDTACAEEHEQSGADGCAECFPAGLYFVWVEDSGGGHLISFDVWKRCKSSEPHQWCETQPLVFRRCWKTSTPCGSAGEDGSWLYQDPTYENQVMGFPPPTRSCTTAYNVADSAPDGGLDEWLCRNVIPYELF